MRVFSFKSLLFILIGLLSLCTNAQAVEKVVATVNGIPILESQVRQVLGKKADTEKIVQSR